MKVSKVEVKIDLGDQVIEILKEGDRPSRAFFTNPLTVRNLENSQLWIEVLRPIMEALDVDFDSETGIKFEYLSCGDKFKVLIDGDTIFEKVGEHRGYCKKRDTGHYMPSNLTVWPILDERSGKRGIPKRKPVKLDSLSADTVFYILPDGKNAYRIIHKDKIVTMYCEEFNLFYSLPPDANVWVDAPKRKQVTFGSLKHDDRFYLDDSSSSVHKKKTNGPSANGYKYNAVKPFDDTWIHLLAYDTVYIDRKDE